MNREELIDQAGKVIWVAGLPERNRDWGERVWGAPNMRDDPARIRALAQADAALAVFEQAHTPTDDEREALVKEARDEAEATKNSYYTNAPLLFRLANALAGFRRPVQAEPQEVDADPDTAFELGRVAGYDEAMREVQAEPTDAMVLAALNAQNPSARTRDLADYSGATIAYMRAALRAALKEGENR